MTQGTTDITFLVCPFTGRNLRLLSQAELKEVNAKIISNELFFYPGAQVKKPLKRALVTEHQTYIYPILDNIVLLKKETAIVAKNRTENYLKRVSDHIISYFDSFYNFEDEDQVEEVVVVNKTVSPMPREEISLLKQQLPNSSNIFVSMASENIDDVHNLVFNGKFSKYVHADFDIERLRSIKSELPNDTLLVLCDNTDLPFSENSIDAIVSFDHINQYDKEDQKSISGEINRVLDSNGVSIIMFDADKPLAADRQVKKDQLAKKAQGLLKPWKKIKNPTIYFHPVKGDIGTDISNPITGKTSLNRQLF